MGAEVQIGRSGLASLDRLKSAAWLFMIGMAGREGLLIV